MFEALSVKLNGVFGRLGNKGRLTEADVDEVLREVRMALLEADVNFRVARDFIARIRERALGDDVLKSLSPGQQVIKITNDALVEILSGGVHRLESDSKQPSVILMVGLNGAGKTTASAKLAKHLKQSGQASVLVAADLQRPAAIQQLETLGKQVDVAVYKGNSSHATAKVAKDGVKRASELNAAWAIVDTAGRFQIDDELMKELEEVKKAVSPIETLLVVDAMTGQEAVQAAQEFHDRIGLTGLILSKMDGDARGGAALSITSVTGVPIKFMGTGEGIDALEQFYPDRLASRILGMGDMLTLIEKAQSTFDETQAVELEKKIRQATFDLEDFLGQLQQLKKMGPISQVLEMLPGFSAMKGKLPTDQLDDTHLKRTEAIIYSMTPEERHKPDLIGGSRRKRIARGSGTTPQDVNQVLNQFKQAQKMMRQLMGGGKSSKKMRRLMQQQGNMTNKGR
ncbi:MAG: signal recognition particle protein [SAR202 cluster bacterium Casp-Chloro-G4]|nr:signal recognition particle protein [Chloroflexota bacterium]MDA1227351.1 signal recognition particle protein [Chloroflexota bacterium]PKB61805.1 MAG: signal recognition particle protein [SAR202 cluster bacterium Casp-Chloro-G4]